MKTVKQINVLILYNTPFPAADVLTVSTTRNVTASSRPVIQLWYVVYMRNFMIELYIVNSSLQCGSQGNFWSTRNLL